MRGEDGSGKLRTGEKVEAVPTIMRGTCIDRIGAGIDGISGSGFI